MSSDPPRSEAPASATPPKTDVYTLRDPPAASQPAETETVAAGGRTKRPASSRSKRDGLWILMSCNSLVFLTSVCIMVLELTASRLVAKHIGQSLYTWTSVIGVVLAGITVGNFIGGWLADRTEPMKTLGWLFLIASAFCFGVLWLDPLAARLSQPDGLGWQTWVLLIVAGMFLLPSVAMGTISPVVASLAVRHTTRTGMTLGNVYAWGAMGSIVGTFLAGFYLIDAYGTKAIVGMTAGMLAGLGVLVAAGRPVFRIGVLFGWMQFMLVVGLAACATAGSTARLSVHAASITSFGGDPDVRAQRFDRARRFGRQFGRKLHELGMLLVLRDDDPDEYHDESNYSYINVGDSVEDGEQVKFLQLDKLVHSYYNPERPTALYYDYEQIYAAVTELAASRWDRTTTVPYEPGEDAGPAPGVFPEWLPYDPAAGTLSLDGAMTSIRREELWGLSESADFWRAVEELYTHSRAPNWGGFEAVGVDRMAEEFALPDSLDGTVQFDSFTQMLTCYKPLTESHVDQLVAAVPDARWYRTVRQLSERSRQVSTFFIGGGGFVFPRWIEAEFPYQPVIHVAEIDPAVKLAVQRQLDLPPDDETFVNTFVGDARVVIDRRLRSNDRLRQQNQEPVLYDFIYGDAFNDFSVPWHLTTLEFTRKVERLLAPEGAYLVNIIDVYPRTELSEDRNALERLPAELLETPSVTEDWTGCVPPFASLELYRTVQDEYGLAFRGIMSDEMRERLLKLEPQDEDFSSAVEELYVRSRQRRMGRFLGSFVSTVSQVFPQVYVFSSEVGRPHDDRDTFVVVCSRQQMDFSNLLRESDHWPGQPFAGLETNDDTGARIQSGQIDSVLALARGLTLTDDHAPVDNLLAPLIAE